MALRREKKRIGDMLIEARVISQEQLEQALPRARETGKKIGETLIEMGFTNEEGIARALSEQLDMELVNLSNYYIEEDILKLVNENVLRKHIMIPYAFDSNNANIVHVAMADPMDMIALEILCLHLISIMVIQQCRWRLKNMQRNERAKR